MSFISKLSDIASNLGDTVIPSNKDAIRQHAGDFARAHGNVRYQRSLNRQLSGATEDTYQKESDRMLERWNDQGANNRSKRTLDKTYGRHSMAQDEQDRLAAAMKNPVNMKDGKLTPEAYKEVSDQQKSALRSHISDRADARDALIGEAKDYFVGGDFQQNATRIGAATVALGAGAVGTRYMSGGSMTHNNQGRRDIAGIPFV